MKPKARQVLKVGREGRALLSGPNVAATPPLPISFLAKVPAGPAGPRSMPSPHPDGSPETVPPWTTVKDMDRILSTRLPGRSARPVPEIPDVLSGRCGRS